MDIRVNEELTRPDMKTVVLFANTRKDAIKGVGYLCTDIKGREDANHQLFFSARLMGAYLINRGQVIDGQPQVTGDRELLIFPAANTDDLKKLEKSKNIVSIHNINYIIGDGEKKIKARTKVIDWLLSLNECIDAPSEKA